MSQDRIALVDAASWTLYSLGGVPHEFELDGIPSGRVVAYCALACHDRFRQGWLELEVE